MKIESKVFIIDDDENILNSLSSLFKSIGIETEMFTSPNEFLKKIPSSPGCLLLDIRMPLMSGLELQDELHKRRVDIPIVFMTGHGDITMAVEAMKKGAIDFIEKPFKDQVLLDAVNKALQKTREVSGQKRQKVNKEDCLQVLTEREREILELLLDGHTTKQIAFKLKISLKTVDFHRHNIFDKMDVDNMIQLVNLLSGKK